MPRGSLACIASFWMAGLWHDPRQPRRLLVPTGWSGPFACLRTRTVRLICIPILLPEPTPLSRPPVA